MDGDMFLREKVINKYNFFLNEIINIEKTNSKIDRNRELMILLEDLIVNDEMYNTLDRENKIKYMSILLFIYSSEYDKSREKIIWTYIKTRGSFVDECNYLELLSTGIEHNLRPKSLINKYIKLNYKWDGVKFYTWTNSSWSETTNLKFSLDKFSLAFGGYSITNQKYIYPIKNLDLIKNYLEEFHQNLAAIISQSLNFLTKYFLDFNNYVENYNNHDLELIIKKKSQLLYFNNNIKKIPCYHHIVNVINGSISNYHLNDKYTVRLSVDANLTDSPIVKSYLNNLCFDITNLATCIIRWGCRTEKTITFISGGDGSGKKTLVKIMLELYKPYVCDSTNLNGKINYNQINTCFYYNDNIFSNENDIRNHPANQLAVIGFCKPTLQFLGGRSVKHLYLSSPISKKYVDTNILTKLTTKKQLSHLLGWAINHYNYSEFNQPQPILSQGINI